MSPEEFRSRFNDMKAGFVAWADLPHGHSVVACAVYDTEEHERAWLAAAAPSRSEAANRLKGFGVHGFKFKKPPSRSTPLELLAAAADNEGYVVAVLPSGHLVVFDPE